MKLLVSPCRKSHSGRERSPRSSNMGKLSSQNRSRSPPPLSPIKEKFTRSPKRPEKEKRTRSPKSARSRSPESHSISPRTKRLKRVKAERDALKGSEREHDKTNGRKGAHKEKDSESELLVGNGSSGPRHRRSPSPSHHHHRGRRRSRSPPSAADTRGRQEHRSSREAEQRNDDNDSIAKMKSAEETLEAKDKQKPSFELSGKLAAETNRFRGVTLLFNEPPDARKPDTRWRLYVFKGGEVLNEPLHVHRQTCYLFGRERRVADIPTDHPSCSKQHAVLQYRQVEEENPDGSMSKRVRPYLMDLGSTNGTFINDNQMEPQRYYELFEKDTIKFGNSSREYVILHENSAG